MNDIIMQWGFIPAEGSSLQELDWELLPKEPVVKPKGGEYYKIFTLYEERLYSKIIRGIERVKEVVRLLKEALKKRSSDVEAEARAKAKQPAVLKFFLKHFKFRPYRSGRLLREKHWKALKSGYPVKVWGDKAKTFHKVYYYLNDVLYGVDVESNDVVSDIMKQLLVAANKEEV